MKPTRSYRLDPRLVKEAKERGIDLVKLFEAAISKVLEEKCPYCGK